MKTIKFALIAFLTITFFNCDNDDDSTNNVCENGYVSTAITNAFATGYDDLPEWMDLETHEYDIQINASGEICTIGYQNPSTYTGSYTMEVINNTSSASYSGVHTFAQGSLDYQSITSVTVNAGDIITVRRTITAGYTLLNETIGRVLRKSDFTNVPYPLTAGNVVFQSSNFYGAGEPVPNIAQPYIALGFKVN